MSLRLLLLLSLFESERVISLSVRMVMMRRTAVDVDSHSCVLVERL